MDFVGFFWRIDYPLTLLVVFFIFFIPLPKKKRWWLFLIIGIITLFSFWLISGLSIFNENDYLTIPLYLVEMGFLFLLIFFTMDLDVIGSLFILAFILSLQHLSFKISFGILNFIDITLFYTIWYFLCSYSTLLVISLLSYFFLSKKLANYIGFSNIYFNAIILTLIIVIEVIFSIFEQHVFFMDFPNRVFVSTLLNLSHVITTILIMVFLYISVIYQKRKEENLVLSLMKNKEIERFEMAKVTIDEINIKYHDLKHMLNEGNLPKEEAEEIQKTVTNYKAIIQTNNVGLNVVIYEAQLKCIKLGIDLNVLLDGDYFKDFKPHHIYSMFSNLLDNAIETVSSLKDPDKKRISLSIKGVRESIIITISNYVSRVPKMVNGLPVSSKKDKINHGYGLKSVKRVVNIYNGIFSIDVTNNIFTIKIIFPRQDHNDE